MNQYPPLTAHPLRIFSMGLAALLTWLMLAPDSIAATASEHANLEVMIRQLNALEETALRSAAVANESGQRYFLDYQRLASDIQRIRHGLKDYLTPSRAQPRDPAELSGNYTLTGGHTP